MVERYFCSVYILFRCRESRTKNVMFVFSNIITFHDVAYISEEADIILKGKCNDAIYLLA